MGKTAPLRTGSSYSEEPIQLVAIDMIASIIGLDLPKHTFHVHAVDARGLVIETSALRRSEMIKFFQNAKPCLVGM